jgi:hypothetical protein
MRGKAVSSLLVCVVMLLAMSGAPAAAEEIMYLTSWQGSPSQINWSVIDYVMYAFSVPDAAGNSPVPGGLSGACQAAHAAGKKCLLSYGGWNDGNDSGFEGLAASASGRSNFANACAAAIAAGADGCDLDWEYPEAEDSANYALLVDAIRARNPGKLVTAAVANHGYNARAVQDACKTARLDFAMIMSYDGGDGPTHSPISYAQTAISDWQSYGVPMSRVFLGVPFYGRPSWAGYNTLRNAGCSSTSDTCTYNGQLVYYNGVPTIQQKRSMIMNAGGRGLMAWEVSFDLNSELQNAMNGGGGNPTPTTARPRATATATTGTRATATATSGPGGTNAYQAAYWTQGNDPCTNSGAPGSGEEWNPIGACSGQAAWSASAQYNGGSQVCRSCGGATPTSTARPTATATTARATATSRTRATATATTRARATATATARARATATATSGGTCGGLPVFQSCTAYANGTQVQFNNSRYTAIAPIPATRDCPPNSPYTPATDNWWTNNGPC